VSYEKEGGHQHGGHVEVQKAPIEKKEFLHKGEGRL